jgi:hypothetical protein
MKRILFLLFFLPVIGFAEEGHWYCASKHGDPFLFSFDTRSDTVTEVEGASKRTFKIGYIDDTVLMWVVKLDRFNHLIDKFSFKKTDFATFMFDRTTGEWSGSFVATFGGESEKLTLSALCHQTPE